MKGETLNTNINENRNNNSKINGIGKEFVLWSAEKSFYLTAPLTGYLLLVGLVSIPVGILLLGGDLLTSNLAKNIRNKKGK